MFSHNPVLSSKPINLYKRARKKNREKLDSAKTVYFSPVRRKTNMINELSYFCLYYELKKILICKIGFDKSDMKKKRKEKENKQKEK